MLSLLEVEKVWAVKRRSIGPIDHTFISATVALSRTVFEHTIVLHILQNRRSKDRLTRCIDRKKYYALPIRTNFVYICIDYRPTALNVIIL